MSELTGTPSKSSVNVSDCAKLLDVAYFAMALGLSITIGNACLLIGTPLTRPKTSLDTTS